MLSYGDKLYKESSVSETRKFFCFLNHSSTRVKVYNCFWNNGFSWGEFTMPSLRRFWTSYELSVYHVWTQKTFRELFSNDLHPKIHATIFKNRTCTTVGVFTLPCKICLCDTLNVYILMTIEEADYYWH